MKKLILASILSAMFLIGCGSSSHHHDDDDGPIVFTTLDIDDSYEVNTENTMTAEAATTRNNPLTYEWNISGCTPGNAMDFVEGTDVTSKSVTILARNVGKCDVSVVARDTVTGETKTEGKSVAIVPAF